jgi:hypothetical protein
MRIRPLWLWVQGAPGIIPPLESPSHLGKVYDALQQLAFALLYQIALLSARQKGARVGKALPKFFDALVALLPSKLLPADDLHSPETVQVLISRSRWTITLRLKDLLLWNIDIFDRQIKEFLQRINAEPRRSPGRIITHRHGMDCKLNDRG